MKTTPTRQEIQADLRQYTGEEVDLWHFAMMNDTARNVAYEKALKNALKNGGTVLDIGTGSGLLAMMAVRNGATRVIACEVLPRIAQKAKEIIRINGFEDRIEVINKKSTQLIPGQDFSERADLLVTEIFDDGLLGEGAFVAIEHAKQNLLKPGAQIIPAGARVIAQAIESQEILENGRVGHVSGFDLSAFNEFESNDYSGYHLDKMKYRAMTAPKTAFQFSFRDTPHSETVPFQAEAIADGVCHAIAYWYELRLDETTVISTAPGQQKLSGWKQAVQLLSSPISVKKGETLKLYAHHELVSLWFNSRSQR